ncbi:MAG: hypothetical protein NVS3B24_14740 [Candidatus Dormibacteria bacterium]
MTDHDTGHVLAEMSRTAAAELLDRALSVAPLGIAIWKAQEPWPLVYYNDTFADWIPEEHLPAHGKPWGEIFETAQSHGVLDVLKETTEQGVEQHFRDYRFVGLRGATETLAGDVTLWDWNLFPLRDEGGAITHLLLASVNTTRQAIEAERLVVAHERATHALAAVAAHVEAAGDAEEVFSRISGTVAELVGARRAAFFRLNAEGSSISPAGASGFTPEELAHLRDVPLQSGATDVASRVVFGGEALVSDLETPEYDPYRQYVDATGLKNAIVVRWELAGRPLGLLGAYDALDGTFDEVSLEVLRIAGLGAGLVWQNQQAESHLRAAQERESARLRQEAERSAELESVKSEFLKLVSHELRGPLTIFRGYLGLLAEGALGPVQDTQERALVVMTAKVAEMSLLVEQMLETARLDDSRLVLKRERVDLGEVCRDVLGRLAPVAEARHHLLLDASPDEVWVDADRSRVTTIVLNLVDNAIKYSPDGGKVEIKLFRAPGTAIVSVTDHGLGIVPTDQEKLFQRFGRLVTPANSHIPGSGLGLYLSRQLAILHGGDISLVSTVDQGTTFTLSLPLPAD